ncbi:uncharacterized protein LOC110253098 [Exaiptasia diaphana]|uniref:Uncharacterized protein n=1 Tax=Exaiptasia diaphana TaxID=2652724 RepID=A0A913Y809_EXADI|nr:uncharacterized protein LOC110253096 [Exaiptasia diaphana]XP_020915630.1 uncharacterized protein LOC110253098 [Exaiptasia diaphana]KXJ22047.1 hypothetical protein AC249_AIPGENE3487 [Exaiptasia diaphana]KXJ22128.1 hypothetical protein AC249_AIPGENE3577 [Exaiptasia diaphana]
MMDLLFYVILIVVIVLKLIFWIFYFYARNRRRQQLLLQRSGVEQTQDRSRQYEEEPAVPQPAYMFTQYPFGPDVPATFLVPPEYAVEDPIKTDQPPPPYSITTIAREESETVIIGDSDTLQLTTNQEN